MKNWVLLALHFLLHSALWIHPSQNEHIVLFSSFKCQWKEILRHWECNIKSVFFSPVAIQHWIPTWYWVTVYKRMPSNMIWLFMFCFLIRMNFILQRIFCTLLQHQIVFPPLQVEHVLPHILRCLQSVWYVTHMLRWADGPQWMFGWGKGQRSTIASCFTEEGSVIYVYICTELSPI